MPDRCRIRPYAAHDAPALQRAADDINVARYMYAGIPHPYTVSDAEWWVAYAMSLDPLQHFVIEVDGMFGGGISVAPETVHDRVGIVGYWLAPEYWGNGFATAAVRLIVQYAFDHGFRRLQASVFAPNAASARVLTKCGFVLEGRLRESSIGRDGEFMDELVYGLLKND
jgi:ribosomal-protein-alanine N-acetyltransferase